MLGENGGGEKLIGDGHTTQPSSGLINKWPTATLEGGNVCPHCFSTFSLYIFPFFWGPPWKRKFFPSTVSGQFLITGSVRISRIIIVNLIWITIWELAYLVSLYSLPLVHNRYKHQLTSFWFGFIVITFRSESWIPFVNQSYIMVILLDSYLAIKPQLVDGEDGHFFPKLRMNIVSCPVPKNALKAISNLTFKTDFLQIFHFTKSKEFC